MGDNEGGGNQFSGELYFTRKQIAERLGTTDGKLRAYTEAAPEFFKGADVGGKGLRYPASSIELFKEALELSPATFREKAKKRGDAALQQRSSSGEILTRNDLLLVFEGLEEAVNALNAAGRMLESAKERTAPPVPDELLTRKEAAARLKCSPRSVSRYVRPFRPGVWRLSDLYRYMETGEAVQRSPGVADH